MPWKEFEAELIKVGLDDKGIEDRVTSLVKEGQ